MSPSYAKKLRVSPAFTTTHAFDVGMGGPPNERLRHSAVYRPVSWMDVVWETYRLGNSGLSGGSFLGTDKALFFPVLTDGMSIFELYHAPGDFFDALQEPGRPEYVKTARDEKYDRWLEIYIQSNPLPVNVYPEAVVPADAGS
jgi:hypothetical protein